VLDYIFCNLYTYVTVSLSLLVSLFILILFPRYSLKTFRHTSCLMSELYTITYIVQARNFATGVLIIIRA